MKVIEYLEKVQKPLISFEIIPPDRGKSADIIYRVVEELMVFKPPFIDVTSHAANADYIEQPDGTFMRKITRKRPGTIGLSAAIKYRFQVETVVHLLCAGFTREETEDALIELNYLGIDNIFAVRGDVRNYKKIHQPDRTVNNYAQDLVCQIKNMNSGVFLGDEQDADPTDFCIGVGAYPEKHEEAPSLAADIRYLKQKVDAGADYIVTQMIFNNAKYFKFVDKCREAGITVPIIPGIKLLTSKFHLTSLPRHFNISFPDKLVRDVQAAKDKAEVKEIGMDHARKQVEELLNSGVPCIHFYIMQDPTSVKKVIKSLGI